MFTVTVEETLNIPAVSVQQVCLIFLQVDIHIDLLWPCGYLFDLGFFFFLQLRYNFKVCKYYLMRKQSCSGERAVR